MPRTHYHQHITASALLGALVLVGYDNARTQAHSATALMRGAWIDGDNERAEDRSASNFVQREIDAHWSKVAGAWTTKFQRKNAVGDVLPGEPDLLYRQLRNLDFTLTPRTLTQKDRAADVQFSADVEFADTSERYYRKVVMEEGPKGWSAWQDAALGAFATIEKRNGKWSITGTDLFDGVKPNASKVPPG